MALIPSNSLPKKSLKGEIITPVLNMKDILSPIVTVAHLQPTSRPIEDRYSAHFSKEQNRLILGVYDGHGGSETAEFISRTLPPRLFQYPSASHPAVFLNLDKKIISDFIDEHSFFRKKSPHWVHRAKLMKAGSTALILDLDLKSQIARFSNLGDCRLVVCNMTKRRISFQTDDLNTKTVSERMRLFREHPYENTLLIQDRLFGRLMCTRGFGDGYFKLPITFLGDYQHRKYIKTLSAVERPGKVTLMDQYKSLFYAYRTPPYITARPHTEPPYQFKKGDLAILATDGLWDLASTQVVVDIVFRGVADKVPHLAQYVIQQVAGLKQVQDDITVIVLQF